MSEKVKPTECYVEQQFLFVQIEKKLEEPQDPSKELETFSMVFNKTFSATFIREVLYIYIFLKVHSTCGFSLAGLAFWEIFSTLPWGGFPTCTSWRFT